MKVALYKMKSLPNGTAFPFNADSDHSGWYRVSEIVEVDFQLIDVDLVAMQAEEKAEEIKMLKEKLAELGG